MMRARVAAAHPRSRGENLQCACQSVRGAGASPLTRGKRFAAGRQGTRPGLIPAHARKTVAHAFDLAGEAAHPRSRGENSPLGHTVARAGGSSPLTRGKLIRNANRPNTERLIPAHAGKTITSRRLRNMPRAHPRSRGENTGFDPTNLTGAGSSPLTRGKQYREAHELLGQRLIPAHAGKTGFSCLHTCGCGAHPRSRGENCVASRILFAFLGSSPLTRGKHHHTHKSPSNTRLIPAHAGKTLQSSMWIRVAWAHPRSRGENQRVGMWAFTSAGSSPLTRGKQGRRH